MEFKKPCVTADVIVEKDEKILLVQRKRGPYKGYWALPGGFLDVDKETVKQTAQRELKEETGLIVKLEDLKLLGETSHPNRDPRGHIVSLFYVTKKYSGKLEASDDAADARFFPLDNLPELAFDHARIIKDYQTKKELVLNTLLYLIQHETIRLPPTFCHYRYSYLYN